MVVHFSWKVLQLMVSDATKKKINIFGTDFLGELVKEVKNKMIFLSMFLPNLLIDTN